MYSPSPSEKPSSNGSARRGGDETRAPTTTTPTTEYILAAIYPMTLFLASAFRNLSPSPAASESYFSRKGNILNVVFVKYGWLWTTFVFLLHLSRLRASSKPKALLRWGLATAWWIIVTQWCFGPPLMDRTFLVTGGACEMLDRAGAGAIDAGMSKGRLLYTSAACKLNGGRWTGGHDLSGHAFLLTHASLFLWSEFLPTLKAGIWGGLENGAVFGLLGIWWWMLLMTGIYFHTWTEKVTGLLVALIQWGVFYLWALRAVPETRVLLGVPGV